LVTGVQTCALPISPNAMCFHGRVDDVPPKGSRMSFRMCAGFVLLLAATGAAAAQEMCGDPPIAPVLPSAEEMRAKTSADAAAVRHNAFADVRHWQGSLKSYRDCLNATIVT